MLMVGKLLDQRVGESLDKGAISVSVAMVTERAPGEQLTVLLLIRSKGTNK